MSETEIKELRSEVLALTRSVEYLVQRQEKQEELIREMMPIAKLAMDATIERLEKAERDGTMEFVRELGGVAKKVRDGFSPNDVRELGDAAVGILQAVRSLTQPDVLKVVHDAADALEDGDRIEPLGLFGMVRATKNADVQRGMAVMMEVLKRVGRGLSTMDTKVSARSTQKKNLERMLGPRRKALGNERHLPAREDAGMRKPAQTKPNVAKPSGTLVMDGVEFCQNGHLANAGQWSEEIASAIAVTEGIELTADHWALINAARKDFLDSGNSPNIRRLTAITDKSTRDIYGLFPKAPGRTIARIAGCPKPAGCL